MLAFCLVLLYNLYFSFPNTIATNKLSRHRGSFSNEDYARYGEAESEHAQILN